MSPLVTVPSSGVTVRLETAPVAVALSVAFTGGAQSQNFEASMLPVFCTVTWATPP